jgi:hypothetical protein
MTINTVIIVVSMRMKLMATKRPVVFICDKFNTFPHNLNLANNFFPQKRKDKITMMMIIIIIIVVYNTFIIAGNMEY